jgi:hypothetical protein
MRVARLETGMTRSEDPPSRSRHLIGNLEVAPLENGELQAKTTSLAYHSHLETGACGNRSRRPVMPPNRLLPEASLKGSGGWKADIRAEFSG